MFVLKIFGTWVVLSNAYLGDINDGCVIKMGYQHGVRIKGHTCEEVANEINAQTNIQKKINQ